MNHRRLASRRGFLLACSVGGSVLAGCSGLSFGSHDGDAAPGWPSYGTDARNTGHVPTDENPPERLRRGWRFETALDNVSPPAFGDGTVYARIGDRLYALDSADGTTRWTTETGEHAGGPVLRDGTLFAGENGDLAAYDAAAGTEQWRITGNGLVTTAPTTTDETVFVAFSLPGRVLAAGTDGEKRWSFDPAGGIVSGPTVSGGTVCFGAAADPAFGGDAEPSAVHALDATDGTKHWTFRRPAGLLTRPAIAGKSVYVGSANGHLYALDRATGDPRWKASVPLGMDSPPSVVGDTVYIGSTDGHVYAFDARDGSREWRVALDGPVSNGVAVSNVTPSSSGRVVYAGTTSGTLFVLTPPAIVDRVSLGAPVATPPAVRGGVVAIGTQDGRVHGLGRENDTTAYRVETESRSNTSVTPKTSTVTSGRR